MDNNNNYYDEKTMKFNYNTQQNSFDGKTDELTAGMKNEFQAARAGYANNNAQPVRNVPRPQKPGGNYYNNNTVNNNARVYNEQSYSNDTSVVRINNNPSDNKSGNKISNGVKAYLISATALAVILAILCVVSFILSNNKIKKLKDNNAKKISDYETQLENYETQIDKNHEEISTLNDENNNLDYIISRVDNIMNYLNNYTDTYGYYDFMISDGDISLKAGEEYFFTIYVENPEEGVYFEQVDSNIAWVETVSEAYDGNQNVKGYIVHAVSAGDVTINPISTINNEILNLNIHVE
ncbi:MAG: hypothetical protein IJ141_05105 [Lachnospiraceae bacterium]|nr:hypothetical protein [Lachnospiraceae bacterium]